jgi:predicted RNA-binding protein associated with RNAse of E/G family
MTSVTRSIQSAEWRDHPQMSDYRAEWLSSMLIERAMWQATASPCIFPELPGAVTVSDAGFIWLRFWLKSDNLLVDKYFDADGRAIGIYMPICTSIQEQDDHLHTRALNMGLWLTTDGGVVVWGEDEFDAAVDSGALTPVEAEQAELRIRELTSMIFQGKFPPALIRNFAIHPSPSL